MKRKERTRFEKILFGASIVASVLEVFVFVGNILQKVKIEVNISDAM